MFILCIDINDVLYVILNDKYLSMLDINVYHCFYFLSLWNVSQSSSYENKEIGMAW